MLEEKRLANWLNDYKPGMLSIVIPAHNESGHIENTVDDITSTLREKNILHEILIINDNSQDETEAILKTLSAKHTEVHYLNNPPPNNGYGYAVRYGLEMFQGEIVAIMMADGSDSPNDLVKFYEKINEGFDCIFGSRFIPGGKTVDYPWPKLFLNRITNSIIQLLFITSCNDITNAFKMFRRDVIAGIQPLLSNHFNLTVELPLKALVRKYKYAVVPNSWHNRKEGISKFNIKEMGSRYAFIILYCYLEKLLVRGDYLSTENETNNSD
jgi:dolichol-phosphate mannosyltransferase